MSKIFADERALWQQALQQDGEAFGQLFDAHRDAVFRQAMRLVVQPADAEDVTSAAFFELWRRRADVRLIDGSVRPWLLVTAANLAKNSRRAAQRHHALLSHIPRERDGDEATRRAFEHVDEHLTRTALIAALRRLRPADAALVTMTALDGYRVTEVALVLGITDGAARVRLHRAHRRLRDLLGTTGPTAQALSAEEQTS